MKSIYARVIQFTNCPSNEYYRDSRKLDVTILQTHEEYSSPLAGLETLKTDQQFTFSVSDLANTSISFLIYETKPSKIDVARLTLPLSWFQPDTRVKDIYPMRALVAGIASPLAEVEIHVSTTFDEPFEVPPGELLVTPGWRPATTDEAPMPAPEVTDKGFLAPTKYRLSEAEADEWSYYYTDSDSGSEENEKVVRKRKRISQQATVPPLESRKQTLKEKVRALFGW